MGSRYVEDPPLVQVANVRIKVARLAVALAARLFSTDSRRTSASLSSAATFIDAVAFLDLIYGMQGFGYAELSNELIKDRQEAKAKRDEIRRWLHGRVSLSKFLRSNSTFRRQDLEEIMNVSRGGGERGHQHALGCPHGQEDEGRRSGGACAPRTTQESETLMATSEQMVKEFHVALDHPIATTPGPIEPERLLLRLRLIAEETAELMCAMTGQPDQLTELVVAKFQETAHELFKNSRPADLIGVADGACDVHVVVSGTCIEFGIPEDKVYEEVHRSNMAKAGGGKDEFGKSIKPEGWTPPDILPILAEAGL
jgi:predicted HAD superfamily Cof-like phosphohydrolase